MPTSNLQIFGVRHHGPGSARSLCQALAAFQPDAILVEGPPDADSLIPLITHPQMRPPVALLIYLPEQPQQAVYYPFAEFSPEWQALQYGVQHKIPVRFMDLPQSHQLRPQDAGQTRTEDSELESEPKSTEPKSTEPKSTEPEQPVASESRTEQQATRLELITPENSEALGSQSPPVPPPSSVPSDPLGWLAAAAGYSDGERWWEHLVEQRQDSTDVFAAILEAMTLLRAEVSTLQAAPLPSQQSGHEASAAQENPAATSPDAAGPDLENTDAKSTNATISTSPPPHLPNPQREAQREAYMRKTIREAQNQGFQRIAVVCGAWHAPALLNMPPAKADHTLLKGLGKSRVEATWVPWTYGRLSMTGGYGAGIYSPGWYHHLWECSATGMGMGVGEQPSVPSPQSPVRNLSSSLISIRWMTRVARLLRDQDLDASSASVIEAVRLAEALAALRDRPLPGLPELNEATQTVLCFGDTLPMQLIHDKLIVGERLGEVPDDTPMVPLQQDLTRQQKRLRLKAEATERSLDLDLRKPLDLERSHLLHRLNLLEVPWGRVQRSTGGKGTFHEIWTLRWQPELAIALIEAGIWGNTIETAATAYACHQAGQGADLPALTSLVDQTLLANLPEAIAHLMARLQEEAAIASDIAHLMGALPSLATILRYGNVRQIHTGVIGQVVDNLVARICIGLPLACASVDDEAAATLYGLLLSTHQAIALLQNPDHLKTWHTVLQNLADQQGLHGLLAGRCCRILLEAGQFAADDVARRLSLALSTANEPTQSAAWVEGFLKGSGLLLLHNTVLWQVIDDWITTLAPDTFTALLPLLRRTFSTFPENERRQMGQKVRGSQSSVVSHRTEMASERFDGDRADTILPLLAQLLGVV